MVPNLDNGIKHNIECPCCQGTGKDLFFDYETCFICEGNKSISTILCGEEDHINIQGNIITLQDVEDDYEARGEPMIAEMLWEFVQEHFKNENWWLVHAAFPMLSSIEEILLDAKQLNTSSIPGGPNNPRSYAMKRYAEKAHTNRIKTQARDETMAKSYSSYKERTKIKEAEKDAKIIREKIQDALKAAQAQIEQLETVNQDIKTMNEPNLLDRAKSGGKIVLEASKKGAIKGTINAANKAVIVTIEEKLGEKYPDLLKTPAGRAALQLMIPAMLLMAMEFDTNDYIPAKDHVRAAAEMAVEGASAEAIEEVFSLLFEHAMPLIKAYASVGERIEDETRQISEDFDAEREINRLKEKKKAYAPAFD